MICILCIIRNFAPINCYFECFFHTYSSLIKSFCFSALSLAVPYLQTPTSDYRSLIFLFHFIFTLPVASLSAPVSACTIVGRWPPPLLSWTATSCRYHGLLSAAAIDHCPPPLSGAAVRRLYRGRCLPPLSRTAVRRPPPLLGTAVCCRYRSPLSATAIADCCLPPLPRAAN